MMDILRAIKTAARLPPEEKYSHRPHVVIFYDMLNITAQ
jgi:hypothetical protein